MKNTQLRLMMVTISLTLPFGAAAQSWPVKPVRIVSTFTSGSPADALMRLVAQKLAEPLGQAVLVEVQAGRDSEVAGLRKALEPLRKTLGQQPYLSGEAPAFADHLVFSTFQWCRLVSPFALLEAGDAIADWLERMLDLDGGHARAMCPAYGAA